MHANTDLIIIGAGAAGLMAACTAAELNLRALVLERKHQPGRKLLMCGNNRCNITNNLNVDEMLKAYGYPSAGFLKLALTAFSPQDLRQWFHRHGLPTSVHPDGRVFPKSAKADDVLHCFTDCLRDLARPVIFNCPVTNVRRQPGMFEVETENIILRSPQILLTTGGVSYPKTGSVGDGQKFAKALGHKITPYRPGLAGFEFQEKWLSTRADCTFPCIGLKVVSGGKVIGETYGEIVTSKWGARGGAIVDASRVVARNPVRDYWFEVDLCPAAATPRQLAEEIQTRLRKCKAKPGLREVLSDWLVPRELGALFIEKALGIANGDLPPAKVATEAADLAVRLKNWRLNPLHPRPLKEAMVTVGGVALEDIDPAAMRSRKCPGLFFAGEIMDIDGPTGGFNLQAAFSTARLAVHNAAGK